MRKKELFTVPISLLLLVAFYLHLSRDYFNPTTPPPPPLRHHHHNHQHLAVSELAAPGHLRHHPPPPLDSVLFPDWVVLLLLPSNSSPPSGPLSCLTHGGNLSPAVLAGTVTSSGRAAFRCSLPSAARRLRPFYTPHLVAGDTTSVAGDPQPEMIRWNHLAYESVSTADDVIVFAKGVNTRQGVNRPASTLRCAFHDGAAVVATTPATTSAQEVFRCPHPTIPSNPTSQNLTVSLQLGDQLLPSLAAYRPPRPSTAATDRRRAAVCACTMVFNVAKFVREWVVYHSSIGVERFVLYDNGSEDELDLVVGRLWAEGYDVTTRFWPWAKTQEAGFSHCAVVERGTCEWVAFIDVDEFLYAPAWSALDKPNRTLIRSLLPAEPAVGQVSLDCREFGPSGWRENPAAGVTQGYTCRRRQENRHKSLVRPEAVAGSLANSVHHFELGKAWTTRRRAAAAAVVNHYKYQAWGEFRAKFRRRVSAYVVDWREAVNLGSRDRAPGLGSEAVEPEGWAARFCEVNDTRLRDTARRWFGSPAAAGEYRMAWQA